MGLWLICDIDVEYWRPAFPFAAIIANDYQELEARRTELFPMIVENNLQDNHHIRHTIDEKSFRAEFDERLGAMVWKYNGTITYGETVNPNVVYDWCVVEIDCIEAKSEHA